MLKKRFWESAIANHILQFIFIFSSVYFAFWLNERNELRKLRKLELQTIDGVYNELQSNLEALNNSIPYHRVLITAFGSYQDSLRGLPPAVRGDRLPMNHLMRVLNRPENAMGASLLKNTAWRFLESSEAYALLDYEVASELASVYQIQETGVQHTVMLIFEEIFWSRDLFRPEQTMSMLGLARLAFTELHGQEVLLAEEIEKRMRLLKERYPIGRGN